jgi:hypothetical protein
MAEQDLLQRPFQQVDSGIHLDQRDQIPLEQLVLAERQLLQRRSG